MNGFDNLIQLYLEEKAEGLWFLVILKEVKSKSLQTRMYHEIFKEQSRASG